MCFTLRKNGAVSWIVGSTVSVIAHDGDAMKWNLCCTLSRYTGVIFWL